MVVGQAAPDQMVEQTVAFYLMAPGDPLVMAAELG